EKLASEGAQVRIAVNGLSPGIAIQNYTRDAHLARLHRLGVQILPMLRLYGADGTTAYFLHTAAQDAVVLEDVDTIVLACPNAPEDSFADAVQGYEHYRIGDCLSARTAEEAVYEGLKAGIDEMRPGRTNKDAADALIRTADKYGLGGRFLSLFIGHGVGIGANEPPYIGETLPGAPTYEFQPGMVFAVEPLIWVEGVRGGGGVRLEEMVLVTEGPPHVMSRAPFDERLML
ncbi:MAG: M24 family metallopeptidase, partial [Xanthobacteraceae bacterium]